MPLPLRSSRSRNNFLYDSTLRVGIVLCVLPVLFGQRPFCAGIQLAIGCVAPQPVAKDENAIDLLTAYGEDVQVHAPMRAFQHAVLVPLRLANPKLITGALEKRH